MAFDGTLKFDTALDESGFQSGLDGLGSLAQKGLDAVKGLAEQVGTAIIDIGKNAIASGQTFEKSMSNVIATMGVTKDTIQDGVNSYDLLKQAAADAGKTTAFSASQAADALNYLALAGYDAVKAADALPAVLDLAAAGNMDLAYASDLATDAMASLGIEASKENLTKFGDKMAKTASRANTSVSQLGEAILAIGGTAKELSGGTTELDAALGVLANRGIKGSEGGTHLRNITLGLLSPTSEKAAEKLKELGIEATDAEGRLRPLNEVMQQFKDAGATTADLNDIFRITDVASVQALIAGCGEEFDNLTNAIDSSDGAMSQMAETMLDNLEGDKKILESATEGFYNVIYDGMNGGLREIVQLATSYMSRFTDAFESGGFEGLASELGNVLGDAFTKVLDYLPDIVQIGQSFLSALLNSLLANSETILNTAIEIVSLLVGGLDDGFAENLEMIVNAGMNLLEILVQAIVDNLGTFIEAGLHMIQALCDVLLNGENLEKLLDAGVTILMAVTSAIVDNLPLLVDIAVQLILFFTRELLKPDNIKKLIKTGVDIILTLMNAIIDNIDELLIAAEDIIKVLCEDLLTTENAHKLLDGGAKVLGELINGLCQIGGKLAGFFVMLFDEMKNESQQIDWSTIGWEMLEGILSGLFGINFQLSDYLDDFKENWVAGFREIFGIHSPSKVMRDEIGKYLALGIGEGFSANIPDVGEDALNAFRLQSANGFGTVRSSPTSEITNNYTYYNSTQNADAPHSQGGDIIIPVSIGGEQLETVVVSAVEAANMRSGGGFV